MKSACVLNNKITMYYISVFYCYNTGHRESGVCWQLSPRQYNLNETVGLCNGVLVKRCYEGSVS